MIDRLSIRNYAIIDDLSIDFEKGFNVFTGETGAGKSIIVGALGLLLGEKGDAASIRTGEEKALIEAEFSVGNPDILEKMKELEIEPGETLIIRREIVQNGKSRVFINGLQEPLAKLEELGEWLVDIHGQHDHQLLLNQKVHGTILDGFGNLKSDCAAIKEKYQKLQDLFRDIAELEQDESKLAAEKMYWETAVGDILKAVLTPGEEEELSESLKKMENAEKLNLIFTDARNTLYDDELAVSSRLARTLSSLRQAEPFDPRYKELVEILEDASAKIDESASLIADYKDELDFDDKTLEEALDRLELIKDLKRKYRKISIEELNAYAHECKDKLTRFENRSGELERLTKEIEAAKSAYIESALALSKKRQESAKSLSAKIKQELSFLGMDKADFITDIKYVKEEGSRIVINQIPIKASDSGIDRVEFLITTNPGEEPKPLRKVASGGEVSRVMLALKSIFAESDAVGTLIFDEIDVGIGGLTANHVGVKMAAISGIKQLIAITHLAQIASKAGAHFLISKSVREGKTFTSVRKITGDDRVNETARMLGGESEASKTHAREMLGNN